VNLHRLWWVLPLLVSGTLKVYKRIQSFLFPHEWMDFLKKITATLLPVFLKIVDLH
jgi:hypothetical protein